MTKSREYDPENPLWWGIEKDGTPNEAKLAQVVEATIRIARPERIILFGSGARGTMNADSDLDILVVAETPDRRATALQIRKARPKRCTPLDIRVITKRDLQLNRNYRNGFIYTALTEGRVACCTRSGNGAKIRNLNMLATRPELIPKGSRPTE